MIKRQAGIKDNDENVGSKFMGKDFGTCA